MFDIVLENIIFLVASFFAAIAATIAGFGSSTLLVPVAIFFMDMKTAVFIVACFHLFNNLFKVKLFWKRINFKVFLQFGLASIVFAYLGAMFIDVVPERTLRLILSVFLILFSIYSLRKPKLVIPENIKTSILGGSLSGFLAGLTGLGGAIRSAFLVSFDLPKEIYVATAALIALVVDLTRIPTYLYNNIVTEPQYYHLLPYLVVTAYLGVKIGKRFLHKISQPIFRKIVLMALLLVGITLLFKG